ncbi:hypothetical protein D0962_20540 [Leptolyngbyaceae cyanobacterium CCMR0082]|uniref:Uncharacterized protein n=1 Tax=Adonisia turfae CCMR0082 TaxID=2304604 RepID=A0A6M0S9H4_9CYAN|nr:hypothetical protein [Adonisia turfae]NEZ65134.1 hypothetical protein [Adonisia turfae CCMR0082]
MLNGKIINEWKKIHLPEQLRIRLIQLLTWDGVTPPFSSVGRTAFVALPDVLPVLGSQTRVIRSLKIKGIGLRDYAGIISPPSVTPYYRANMHLGFDAKGQPISVASEPSPLGGMTLTRAQTEFECSKTLYDSACPAELPVAIAFYPDLEFSAPGTITSNLGAVICGLPARGPARLDELLVNKKGHREFLVQSLEDMGLESHYELLCYIYTKIGETLNKFHKSGFYRYSGHPGNFIFDSELQEAILVDLDSSQLLEKVLANTKKAYIARDIVSAIYHLGAYVLRSDNIAYWKYTPQQTVNLMAQVISGYFANQIDSSFMTYFHQEYLSVYSEAIHIAAERHRLAKRKKSPPIKAYQAYRTSKLHHYWIDRDKHFEKLMSLLIPIF